MRPKEQDGKKVMACSCGYCSDSDAQVSFSEKVKNKDIEVVSDGSELDTLPKTDATCPKCANETCYYWLVQTRAADEPETKFLKCTKCKHTFRDYG